MFNIYIRNFNQNGTLVTEETLLQTIPATSEGELKLVSPIPKCEMGKAECLDFSIESGTKFYDAFLQMKTYIRIEYDGDTIFYGRVLTIDNNGFRGTRKIRCEGPLSLLLDSPVEGIEETKRDSITVYAYMQKLIDNHNAYVENDPNKKFILGEVPGNYSSDVSEEQKIKNDKRAFGSDSWTDTKSALEDLRSHYGGYFRTRVASDGIYLDWMNHYFNSNLNTQTVEVGKNILDISDITEIDNIFTAIIPIGKGTTTKSNGQSGSTQTNLYIDDYKTEIHGANKILKVSDITKVYTDEQLNSGYHKAEHYKNANTKYGTIIKTVSFSDATTKEKLFDDACEWIKNNYQDDVTKFSIKAIDMRQIGENTSKITVGDRVKIIYPVGNESEMVRLKSTIQTCLNITYDLYHPENNSYTFGIPANILTKTYGLKKQSKSVKGGGGGNTGDDKDGSDPEKNLLNLVAGWLMRHGLTYTGPKPYKNSYGTKDEDTEHQSSTALYEPSIISGDRLVKATRVKWKLKKEPDGSFVPSYLLDNNEKVYPDEYYTDTEWKGALASIKSFSLDTIVAYHVPEYVKYEYGVDLWIISGGSAPTITIGEDGEVSIQVPEVNPDTGEVETVKRMYIDGTLHEIGFYGPDNEKVYSMMDSNGNWTYWYQDKDGNWKTTNVRDLSIMAINTENKVGWIVQEDEQGDLEFANPGEMTMAIENFIGGPLVVTRVSGELVYLGNTKTQRLTAVSLNHMDQVCGDVEYVPDELDPNLKNVVIKSGGGTRTRYYKKALKKGGDPNNPDDWEYEKVIDPITGKEAYVVSETGVYTEDNLVGGIISSKLNDGTVREKIFGDYVDLVANNVAKFGIIDPETGTLTGGVITEKLNDQGDTYTKIKGKYIDITADQVLITDEPTSESLKHWMDDTDYTVSETIMGSAIWRSRDQVVNVAGQYRLERQPDGTFKMVVIAGGGMTIERDNTQFGIYDEGTLSGGIITEKLADGTVTTKISGDIVDVKATNLAKFGIIDPDTGTLTGGLVVEKLNAQGDTYTKINGKYIDITADDIAKFGIVDPNTGTLTGGVITQKLNAQGDTYTKINGKYLDLNASTIHLGNTSDIEVYETRADFPIVGNPNITYIAKDTRKAYMYDPEVAKTYVEVDHTFRTLTYLDDGIFTEQAAYIGDLYSISGDLQSSTEANGKWISDYEGTAIWKDKDHIVNVAGQYRVEVDQETGEKRIVVISGGGMTVDKNGTEYGIFHDGNLTGGVVTQKLNAQGDTYTKIKGTYLDIETAQMNISNPNVKAYAKRKDFPVTGNPNYTYVDKSTKKVYIWNPELSPAQYEETSMLNAGAAMSVQGVLVADAATIGELNAYKAEVNTLLADYIKVTDLEADIGKVETLYVKNLHSSIYNGECTFTNYYGNNYVLRIPGGGGSVTTDYLQNGVRSISLTQTGNTYSLKSLNYLGQETDIGTFSRAVTSFTGSWSGGVYSMTPIPQRTPTFKIGLGSSNDLWLDIILQDGLSPTKNASNEKYLDVPLELVQRTSAYAPEVRTGATKNATYNATPVWEDGQTNGRNSVTASDPEITAISSVPSGYGVETNTSVKSKTSTGKESTAKTISYTQTTYTQYQTAKTRYCVKATDPSGNLVGLKDIQDFYDGAVSTGETTGRNSVTASAPVIARETADDRYASNISVKSKTSTNKESSASIITFATGEFNQYGVSDNPHKCLNMLNGGTNVGRYDLQTFYNNAKTDGEAVGRNSVTASAPELVTISKSGDVYTPANIQVRSKTSTGKVSDYKTLSFSNSTYKIPNSTNNHCVAVKDGSTLVGLYSIETVYTEGKTDGKNDVTLNTPKWNDVSVLSNSRTVSVTTNGRPTQLQQTKTVYITSGGWDSGSNPIYIRDGSSTGTIVAQSSVSIPSVAATTWTNTTGRTWRADISIGGVTRSSSTKDFGGYFTDGYNSVRFLPTWDTNIKNKLTISKTNNTAYGTDCTVYVVAGHENYTYNTNAHTYTFNHYAKADANTSTPSTIRSSSSQTTGTEAWEAGKTNGYNSVRFLPTWDTNNKNKLTLTKTSDTSYGTSYTLYVVAGIDDYTYSSTTHKYTTTARAKAGTSASGATERSTESKTTGTEAYDDGWYDGFDDTSFGDKKHNLFIGDTKGNAVPSKTLSYGEVLDIWPGFKKYNKNEYVWGDQITITAPAGYSKSIRLYCSSVTPQSSGYYIYRFTVEDRSGSKFTAGNTYTFHYN